MKTNDNDQDKDQLITTLQNEVDTLKSILYMMPGNVYWIDSDNKYMGCNYNVAKLLKLNTPDEVVGKINAEVLTGIMSDKVERVDTINRMVLSSGKAETLEEVGHTLDADGNNVTALYLTQKSPLYDKQNKIKGLLGVSLDITERKNMEEKLKIALQKADAANRAKSEFLALISHELRTPLTSILGFANFLAASTLDATQKKHVRFIANSGSYLLSLINNLLDYSRLEADKFELKNSPFNLKKLINSTLSMLSSSAKVKKISLKLDYDKNAPQQILADDRILQQILVNLIGNAIKFTEKGHVIVRVKPIKQQLKYIDLQIAVEDTGPGISDDDIKSIFKPFYQVENVYKRDSSQTGTGLGLAIVKKLTELMGCKIEVDSHLSKGSCFHFTGHFQRIPDRATSLKNANLLKKSKSRKKRSRILLVEDNELIQLIHITMLKESGCHVDTSGTAKKALSMLKKKYDILFIDIGLPDIDGFELIKTIREQYTKEELPIIALTGFSGEDVHQHCLNAGACEVVTKPISKGIFEKLLEYYLPPKV